ncbi:MAG: PQQ-dependent sugar dehydrogenase [Chloroflexota bacterium]
MHTWNRLFFLVVLTLSLSGLHHLSPVQAQSSAQTRLDQFDRLTVSSGWVLSGQSLFWTSDAGQTWEEIGPAIPVTASVQDVEFRDSDTGWVLWSTPQSDGSSLFTIARTFNHGNTWDVQPLAFFESGEAAAYVERAGMGWFDAQSGWIAVKQATSSNFSVGVLFTTSDGGATWTRHSLPVADQVTFSNPQIGWAFGGPAGDQIFQTRDGGVTWRDAAPAHSTNAAVTAYAPYFFNGQGLLVTTSLGETNTLNVFAYDDANDGWLPVQQADLSVDAGVIGLSILDAQNFLAVIPGTASLLRMENGVLRSLQNTDGLSASIVDLDMISLDDGWAKSVQSDCTTASSPDGGTGSVSCTSTTRLLQTTDGGSTWSEVPLPIAESVVGPVRGAENAFLAETDVFTYPNFGSTEIFIGQGFDKCEIPTLAQLQTWWNSSPYKVVNLYIGGSSRACANSALTASYVQQLNQQGWKFIPTWVGPQAPCTGYLSRMSSDPTAAYNEGVNEANLAVEKLSELGFTYPDKTGSVVYYDIEYYGTNTACRDAVNAFMNGWVSQIRARGNLAGVYGSTLCNTGLSDFRTIANVPDVIWPARWYHNLGQGFYDSTATVWDLGTCLPNTVWANHQRIRQYEGEHDETWGSLTLPIDSNVLDGVVAVPALLEPARISFTEVAAGLSSPVFITHAGDASGRLFVVEQAGRIRVVKNGSLLSTPFLDIQSIVKSSGGEQGLLGLAFHPSYETNGKFYVLYTAPRPGDSTGSILTLRQYSVSTGNADTANPSSGVTLLTIDHPTYSNHNGGTLAFGADGYLYWSTGDGGSGGDPFNNAQTLTSLLGKILRLDVDSASPYAVPASNPFSSDPNPNKKLVWAYGLRNPWRMSFDRLTHDLYIGDVGQGAREEIDFQPAASTGGENYGWRIMEGSLCYNPSSGCDQTGKVLPVAEYDHSLGCAVTGGYVYRGTEFPSLQGYYLYGDFCSGRIWAIKKSSSGWSAPLQLADTSYNISTFGEDESGKLYLADLATGRIYEIRYNEPSFTLSGNAGASGVTLSYTDGAAKTATSAADGSYSLTVSYNWSGTVTPSHPCYTFTPASRTYTNVTANQTGQNYTATFNSSSGCANVNVNIGGAAMGNYGIPPGKEERLYYPVSGGPVKVESTNGVNIVSAIRLQSYANNTLYSFVETMGVPQGLLSYKYVFPTYNNTWTPLNSQIRVSNLETTPTTVRITIGNDVVWEQQMQGLEEQRLYFNTSGGPVIVESLDTSKKIVAAIRLQSYANNTLYSFSETMGIPDQMLSYRYYFPTYNNTWAPLNSQIRVSNLETTPATVRITIGNDVVWEQQMQGREEQRLYFPVSGGPVIVESLDTSKKIVAAIRLQSYANNLLYSFVETMGVPEGLLSHKYYFPTYNNTWAPLNSQIRVSNLETTPTTVRITIGNDVVWERQMQGREEQRLYFPVSGGPVIVESLDTSKKIVAAIRLQSYANNTLYSFSETMGIPLEQMTNVFYFPTYNNTWAPLNSQLRFGVP